MTIITKLINNYLIEGEEKNFKSNKYNGTGKHFYDNGNIKYEGQFKDGKYNGTGKSFYENGKIRYKGQFKDDKLNGTGKLFYDNGKLQYEGDWIYGRIWGTGKLFYVNGKLGYEGQFKDGLPDGTGKGFYQNGKIRYKGQWYDGKYNGRGKLYDINGNLEYEGEFVNGTKKVDQIDLNIKEFKKYKNTNTNQSFDDIKKEIHKLFGSKDIFEKWITNFTPSDINKDVHGVYKSIENIHYVFRIIQDITMNENKTRIKSDGKIEFKVSDSNYSAYVKDEITHILNKYANNLYRYLIRKHQMNEQKKSFFSRKKTRKNNAQKSIDKTCFGIEYSKEIHDMIIYSILNNREGLTSIGARVPVIIMNKTIPPEEPDPEPEKPIEPIKDSISPENYESEMIKYNLDMEKYKNKIKEIEKIKKNISQYKENKNSGNYVEVGDTCLNIIRLIDAFIETLPYTLQTEIARTYMIDYIEGYDSKICSFNPKLVDYDNFIASCGLGNLKKLIISLYNVLSGYVDNKKPEIKYIQKKINCKGDFKFTKLFYGSNTDPKCYFKKSDSQDSDKKEIEKILSGWYENYYQLLIDNKTYKDFLNYIIVKWYENQCDIYNTNENFILYNFGYIWKKIIANSIIITSIDDSLDIILNNNNNNKNNKADYEKAINKIEIEFVETPECVVDDNFNIPDKMFAGINITINPIVNDEEQEFVIVGGNNFKILKSKKINKLNTINSTKRVKQRF